MNAIRLWSMSALIALVAIVGACGAGSSADSSARTANVDSSAPTAKALAPTSDWTRFGFDAARYDAAPHGISAADVSALSEQQILLPGTVDSSPIYLGGVHAGGATRDLLIVTTTYGRTLGIDAGTGAKVWTFTPGSYGSVAGSAQITTASPIADPGRQFVYAASPDGVIHKLNVSDGSEVRSGGCPVSITRDATHEKIGPPLNIQRSNRVVTTGGHLGARAPLQAHVLAC